MSTSQATVLIYVHIETCKRVFEGDLQQTEENLVILDEGESIIRGTCKNTTPEIPLSSWEQYYT